MAIINTFGVLGITSITSAGSGIRIFDSSSTNSSLITPGSNESTVFSSVGVGTTNPRSTVDVFGSQANTSATSASQPSGTLRLAFNGGATIGDYGSSLVFTQRWWNGEPNVQIAVGQIAGVKIAGDGNFGGGLAFFTSNGSNNNLLERMRIDNAGRVLNSSAQPYFYARGPESNTTLTNGADLNFNNAIVNNGNHYNTSNFRFTAPIAGRYLFTWSVFVVNAAGRCVLKVNNASFNNLQMDVGGGMSQSAIIQLNANDFVSVGDWQSISNGVFYMGHSHFSGILLG